MRKKAVLIAAANDFAGNVNVSRLTPLLAPPISTLALGSYLAAHDVPVELIDVQMDFGLGLTRDAERAVSQRVAQYLRGQSGDIAWVGVSQLSNAGSGIALVQEIHAALPEVPIIFGGYFPSSVYQHLLEKYPFITAVVRGDGEVAALHISHSLAQGQSFLSAQTPNLAWRDGDEIRTTPARPVPLDNLSILDYRLLRNPACYQIIDLMTSRGCPFGCYYCLEGIMRPYTAHSPDWVAQQLNHLEANVPNDRVFIYDPVFGLGRRRALELCQVLGKRRFTYAVESRADVLSPDLIPTLRKVGVEAIFWGIESASARTLLRMNKVRSVTDAQDYVRDALEVLRACFENDVTPMIGFMLGFPGDSEADYQITLDFIKNIGRLYSHVAAETGTQTGFVPFAFHTKVYHSSPLAACVESDFPETVLRSEPFIGEKTVVSPSPGVDLEMAQCYQAEIARLGGYTPRAMERLWRYFGFSMDAFLTAHPQLTDSQGVTQLGDSFRRFPQVFDPASLLMQYDKSKD